MWRLSVCNRVAPSGREAAALARRLKAISISDGRWCVVRFTPAQVFSAALVEMILWTCVYLIFCSWRAKCSWWVKVRDVSMACLLWISAGTLVKLHLFPPWRFTYINNNGLSVQRMSRTLLRSHALLQIKCWKWKTGSTRSFQHSDGRRLLIFQRK